MYHTVWSIRYLKLQIRATLRFRKHNGGLFTVYGINCSPSLGLTYPGYWRRSPDQTIGSGLVSRDLHSSLIPWSSYIPTKRSESDQFFEENELEKLPDMNECINRQSKESDYRSSLYCQIKVTCLDVWFIHRLLSVKYRYSNRQSWKTNNAILISGGIVCIFILIFLLVL